MANLFTSIFKLTKLAKPKRKKSRKKRLTKKQNEKRENIKWTIMFIMTVGTISLYLAAFIEIDKTQANIDFNRKTLAQLNEDLTLKINSVEKMKRADIISKKQEWNIQLSKSIKEIPNSDIQKFFVFKNGIKGDGIFGFQNEIFSSNPGKLDYTALGSMVEVTWKPGQKEIVFESVSDIISAEKSGRIKFNETNIIVNTPQIVWPDGQMKIRSDVEITDEMSHSGGQIVEINRDDLSVTFVAHRSWDSDGRTIYYIITDATPLGPAELMGVAHSPLSTNFLNHSGIVDLFQFKNGIKGSGSLGFQPEILGVSFNEENYSPISKIYLVEWHDSESAQILQTKSDIDSFNEEDLLTVSIARPSSNEYVINSPTIDPFQ